MGEDAGSDDSRPVAMTVLHEFAAAGSVTVSCNNPAGGASNTRVGDKKVTALQLRSFTNGPVTSAGSSGSANAGVTDK